MEVLRKIRIVSMVMALLFCWGIAGSIELERLTLSQGIEYICFAFSFMLFALVFEFVTRFAIVTGRKYIRRYRIKRIRTQRFAYIDH